MFSKKDIAKIDHAYFVLLASSPFAITIRSRNTGHEWHLIAREGRGWESCEVYHRHSSADPWHRQWGGKTLEKAMTAIREHDTFQMRGRKE